MEMKLRLTTATLLVPPGPSIAESAAFFEIRLPPADAEQEDGVCHGAEGSCASGESSGDAYARRAALLSEAFDEKSWAEEDFDAGAGAALLAEYAALHARMALPATPKEERRLLILDQRAVPTPPFVSHRMY